MFGLCLSTQVASGSILRDVSAALAWLEHCQRYGIKKYVEECELEIGRHYLVLANDRAEELAALSSSSLIRISRAYAHCSWVASSDLQHEKLSALQRCYSCRSVYQSAVSTATADTASVIDGSVAPSLKTFMRK